MNLNLNEILTSIIVALVPSVIIAYLSAKIAIYFSLNQFREEHRWEKKYEAYEKIMVALHHMLDYDCQLSANEEYGYEMSEERKMKLNQQYSEGWKEFTKAKNLGTFLISNESVICLKELAKKIDEVDNLNGSFFELFDNRASITEEYLELFRERAMQDLRLSPRKLQIRLPKMKFEKPIP
jgi:hypothetical protein